jgi:hypothetical protein
MAESDISAQFNKWQVVFLQGLWIYAVILTAKKA